MSKREPLSNAGRLGVALIAMLLAAPAASPAEPRASLPDIEDEVMCPICGTLLELSDAPQAERERTLIRQLIAEGRSKEQIKDALVAEYGPDVLAAPQSSGFDLAAWLIPGLGIGLVAAALVVLLRRWRREDDAGRPPAAPDPGADDLRRLKRDMASDDA